MDKPGYRPDIDGLRAVAVVLTVLYHARLAFPGGFVGVDVFFVISGYLITGLILREQEAGNFSLAEFWSRRIRRIAPASLAMTLATLAAGAVVLFPRSFDDLAESALWHQAILANLHFWRTSDYFGGPSEFAPLLHTWSLAVEEQFYLVYPLLLLGLRRRSPRSLAAVLGAVTLASFAASVWCVRAYPSAAFYFLGTRAWELLLGGLLCLLPTRPIADRLAREAAAAAGLAAIAWSAACFDRTTRFPGEAALVPCLAAAAFIHANSCGPTLAGRAIAWRPIVAVGLISYSLYLWHWPILALARGWLAAEPPPGLAATLVAAGCLVAWGSWRWIETPVRRDLSVAWRRPVVAGLCAAAPLVIAACLVVCLHDGFPGRVAPRVARYLEAQRSSAFEHRTTIAELRSGSPPAFGAPRGDRTCLVWGDSHAMAMLPGIAAACREAGVVGHQATWPSVPPLLDFVLPSAFGLRDGAPAHNRAVLDFAIAQGVDVVFLAAFWTAYAHEPGFETALQRTVDALTAADIAVVIVEDVASFPFLPPALLARRAAAGRRTDDVGIDVEIHRARNRACNDVIRRIAGAAVVDPEPRFVDATGRWRAEIDGTVLYRDDSHLSVEGGRRLAPLFARVLAELPLKHTSRDGMARAPGTGREL